MNIVVLDGKGLNPGDLSWEWLKEFGNPVVYDRTEEKDIVERASGADIILTNKTIITAGTLMSLPRLKYIGVLATGYNVVDVDAARTQGVVVTNIPAYSTTSVAQMAFAHILNITNQVGHYARENSNGRWCKEPDFCYWDNAIPELARKKIGIIGLGNTGMAVARIALAFGMEVYAGTSKNQLQLGSDIRKATLEEILRTCDIVSLHCPLNQQTRHIINQERLSQMKQNSILINVSRGALVNEQDLADALNSGRIGAYGTDVLSVEPAPYNNPLLTARNCYITPHIAWASTEARERLMSVCRANIQAFVSGNPQNVVNK